jgi:hypothetical protein
MYGSLAPGEYVGNDDGTTFKDYHMGDDEMAIAYQLAATLVP